MKAIVVGILPQDLIRERMLAIARGEYKPNPTDPKIWFTSMQSLHRRSVKTSSLCSRSFSRHNDTTPVDVGCEQRQSHQFVGYRGV